MREYTKKAIKYTALAGAIGNILHGLLTAPPDAPGNAILAGLVVLAILGALVGVVVALIWCTLFGWLIE